MRIALFLAASLFGGMLHAASLCPVHTGAGIDQRLHIQPEGQPALAVDLRFDARGTATYAVVGTLDEGHDAYGVTGSARCRDGKLLLDVIISAGFAGMAPDDDMRALYGKDAVPSSVDAAGYSVLRAVYDPAQGKGTYQALKQVVLTGGKQVGPMLQHGSVFAVPPR